MSGEARYSKEVLTPYPKGYPSLTVVSLFILPLIIEFTSSFRLNTWTVVLCKLMDHLISDNQLGLQNKAYWPSAFQARSSGIFLHLPR